MVTWLQNTLKLVDAIGSRALQQRERRRRARSSRTRRRRTRPRDRGAPSAMRRASSGEYTKRTSAPPRLGLAAGCRRSPGTRIMSPNDVKITPGVLATAMASSTRPIGITHTGQPGPCTSSTDAGQDVLDPVAVDRVGVPAAHLHELEVVVAGELGDAAHEGAGGDGIAVLVDEAHAVTAQPSRSRSRLSPPLHASASADPSTARCHPRHVAAYPRCTAIAANSSSRQPPRSWSDASACAASSSSIFDIANPTWMSTQSPGSQVLVLEQADVHDPADAGHVDTREVLVLVESSTTWPGMPRHIVQLTPPSWRRSRRAPSRPAPP